MDFEQKKVNVDGVEYTLQRLPVRAALKLKQQWQDSKFSEGIDSVKMCDLCFNNIVVEPKVKLDDFEYPEDAEALALECVNFQYMGKPKTSKEK